MNLEPYIPFLSHALAMFTIACGLLGCLIVVFGLFCLAGYLFNLMVSKSVDIAMLVEIMQEAKRQGRGRIWQYQYKRQHGVDAK
jgi:hypothetical protein